MRYRKKPVIIDAWQWKPDDMAAAGGLIGVLMAAGAEFHHSAGMGPTTTLTIMTLEGEMTAQPGDWIIRGVKGEFYPCKPDIFAANYLLSERGAADGSARGAPLHFSEPRRLTGEPEPESGAAVVRRELERLGPSPLTRQIMDGVQGQEP